MAVNGTRLARFGSDSDPFLLPYEAVIRRRHQRAQTTAERLTGGTRALADIASGHEFFGLHRSADGWVFREWAPNADAIFLIGTFSDWQPRPPFALERLDDQGTWQVELPDDALRHGDLYRLAMRWPGGGGDRIPAYARRVVQDSQTHIFNAQVWAPKEPYQWQHAVRPGATPLLIYEAHVGMAQEQAGIGGYLEFRDQTLPRIIEAGYTTIQLMAVMEHPYYGSFGYHVSNFFAASSRFGTPHELKALIDAAHGAGLRIIMDLVHSHAVRNQVEGLALFDGTQHQYFHAGDRGYHAAWDSFCFDYGKPQVLHFLLSNCRFWLDEYRFDGFRFDGVTSMLYHDHGFGSGFGSYDAYFGDNVDEDALVYLALANEVVHSVRPGAITIAEDVSGMPGLAAPRHERGVGFDFRLSMGVPDCWFKLLKACRDDDWPMGTLWHELTNRRRDERTISYAESHDQAIVGGKTIIFELSDAAMYTGMHKRHCDLAVERGLALHKMIRLATLSTAGHGYLNFMGNEFGHPEWVDFPREGNNWSYHYARRQWSLRDSSELKYHFLADFDQAMLDLTEGPELFAASAPELVFLHEDHKVLVHARGRFCFFYNFHPAQSQADYRIPMPPGSYRLRLDTDEQRFGGQGRLHPGQTYQAMESADDPAIRIYLPCRTAAVLERQDDVREAGVT